MCRLVSPWTLITPTGRWMRAELYLRGKIHVNHKTYLKIRFILIRQSVFTLNSDSDPWLRGREKGGRKNMSVSQFSLKLLSCGTIVKIVFNIHQFVTLWCTHKKSNVIMEPRRSQYTINFNKIFEWKQIEYISDKILYKKKYVSRNELSIFQNTKNL